MFHLLLIITALDRVICVANIDVNRFLSKDHQIFSSSFNITRLFVPVAGGSSRLGAASNGDIPSIYFTVADPSSDSGSSVYVLEELSPFQILDGGRDITSDYGSEPSIYLGSKDGIYKYDPGSASLNKYGPFRDDILQLQKAKLKDSIYILDATQKIYAIQNNGTVRTKVSVIQCASEFVLDTSDNLYYIDCEDNSPSILLTNGRMIPVDTSAYDDLQKLMLVRPALMMDDCVPMFANGSLYIVYYNGTMEAKGIQFKENPTSFSIDTGLYIVVATQGKIFEFNLSDMLLKSMFGMINVLPTDLSEMIMSILGISTNAYGIAIS